jgi:2-amino-4-hydroxy-6-hydroxymethyldihydropteridine diphosphokinase
MIMRHRLVLGLGSNVGQRQDMMAQAVEALRCCEVLSLDEVRVSRMIQTPAMLPDGAPPEWDRPYLNAVVVAQCAVAPEMVLLQIKHIEHVLGRQERGRWGPREIDIDIVAYGDHVLHTTELTIPHADMLQRDFVLLPLMEVYPEWVYPDKNSNVYGLTAAQLLQRHLPSI